MSDTKELWHGVQGSKRSCYTSLPSQGTLAHHLRLMTMLSLVHTPSWPPLESILPLKPEKWYNPRLLGAANNFC